MARLYRQAAMIPIRIRDERVEIALVTTLSGKRWVVPKVPSKRASKRGMQHRKAREDESLVTARLSRCVGRDFADYCTCDRSRSNCDGFGKHTSARALWISRRRSSAREDLAFPD